MTDADIVVGIVASVLAFILAAVVIAYTVQTAPGKGTTVNKGTTLDGTRQFLMAIAIIVLVLVFVYWIITGIRNRERISAAATSLRTSLGI